MIRPSLIAKIAIAGCSIGAVWVAVGTNSAKAQQGFGGGGFTGPVNGVTRQAGPGNLMAGPGMFGTAITVDESYVYIVRGSEVFKLRKTDLAVVATGMLPSPPGQFGNGIKGTPVPPRGGFGGGGFQAPRPPGSVPPPRQL